MNTTITAPSQTVANALNEMANASLALNDSLAKMADAASEAKRVLDDGLRPNKIGYQTAVQPVEAFATYEAKVSAAVEVIHQEAPERIGLLVKANQSSIANRVWFVDEKP